MLDTLSEIGGFVEFEIINEVGIKKLGFEDTRGTLFFEIARILKAKQPKAFLQPAVQQYMWL